jgi:hypothetical protein
MARQKLTVTYVDGRVASAKITPRVEVALEKNFNIGLGTMQNAEGMHAEYLYYMAWAALHYSGQEGKNFEDFLNVLEDVDMVDPKPSEEVIPFPTDQPHVGSLP